jgi:tetratricopeptide (TPR) repeat protein
MKLATVLVLALAAAQASCVPPPVRGRPSPVGEPEAVSLFGHPLYAPELPLERRQRLEEELAAARAAWEKRPDDVEAIIWYGRRTAYLGRYRDAIRIFSDGIRQHPRDPRLYRHRGHRYITVRRFDRALTDLSRAAWLVRNWPLQVEPDGMPNERNVPLTTLQGNIWYHLGLAHYLTGEFGRAADAFRQDLALARNDDNVVAASDWLYMSLRRQGKTAEAAQVLERIRPEMEIIENQAYHRRLLMYKGLLPPDSLLDATGKEPVQAATEAYGVAAWYLYNGQRQLAEDVFWRIVAAENWAPFGYIAAEADLRRLQQQQRRRR